MNKHVINLDLHGGDFAPNSVLEGASIALSKHPTIHFKLHSTKELQKQYSKKFSNIFRFYFDWINSLPSNLDKVINSKEEEKELNLFAFEEYCTFCIGC